MLQESANTLAELVRIPSVNPMGRPVDSAYCLETRLSDYLENWLRELDVGVHRITVDTGRDNVIGRIDGNDQELILLEVHQDTVPVDGMTIEPWAATIEDGRLYGRGACDVKGGMAAMLHAFRRLAKLRSCDTPTVILACTVNEEYGFTGSASLARLWTQDIRRADLFPRTPDVCIVAEPTDLKVVAAHKGVLRWRCHTHGLATHSSRPESGVNAIYKMSPVIAAVEQYGQRKLSQIAPHVLCGGPTLCVGTIAGGISANTVPDICTIEIDRRLVPGEDPKKAKRHVEQYIDATGIEADHELPYLEAAGLSDRINSNLAERLATVARRYGGTDEIQGAAYATDASMIAATGVPTVVFGPGSIDQAHTADEWIDLQQVEIAAEIYYRFCTERNVTHEV